VVTRARLGPLARHRWYAAAGAGACITAAAVGGALILQPGQTAHHPRALAADCGIVTCTATIPPRATASATAARSLSPSPRHATAARRVAHSPGPSPATPATAPARIPPSPSHQAPSVSVAYSVVQRWAGGLQGQFTIVNHGSAALTRWEIRAVLPGDQIDSAWGSGSQISGDTLVLVPSYPPSIPAGASQSMDFTAQGNTARPATCTLDGAACG
jgi:hypothetical protein